MRSLLCPVLIDRDDALGALRAALSRASTGSGGVVFVLGEAGTGKSRLASEARRIAEESGMVVASGRAVERASPRPYRPVAEAVRSLPPPSPEEERREGDAFTAHRLLWGAHGDVEGASELAVAEALSRALGAAGRRGCLLVLEDLHWADPETLAVSEYLADHLSREPAVLLATVRVGEGSAAERLAHLLHERRAADLLRLSRLSGEGTQRMLAACLGSEQVPKDVARFIDRHAEGVPLFVEELVAGLVDSGALDRSEEGWRITGSLSPVVPVTYAELVRRRLQQLEAHDRDVVLGGAVLGRRFRWSLLPAMTGRDEGSVLESLRRAAAGFLLEPQEESPDSFRFRHALTRDAVLAELLPPEQAAIASRALHALDAAAASSADDADLAAELAERAGDRPRAVAALLEVSRGALRRGALRSARAALERASRLAGTRPELSVPVEEASAHAAALAGDVDDAIRRAAVVLASLPPGPASAERRARLHLTLARASLVAGRVPDAARHVADALSLAKMAEPAVRASAEALAAQVAITQGRTGEAERLARSALEEASRSDTPAAACEALEVLGRVARTTDLARAEALFLEALAIASQHHLDLWRARALHELGTIDLYTGRHSDRFEKARAAAAEAGAVATIALCDLHLAVFGFAHWEVENGIAAGRRCVDLSRRLGLSTLGMGLVHLGACLGVAGEEAEMERVLDEAEAFAADEPDVAVGIPGRARMGLAARRGDLRSLRAALDEAMTRAAGHPGLHFPFRGLWALLHTVVGPDGDGGAHARQEVATTPGGLGTVFNRMCLDMAEAVARGRGGRAEEATGMVRATLVEEHAVGAGKGWEALVLAVVAAAALSEGWGQGEQWARHALAYFEGRDFPELASWCRSMLRDAGRPVPRRGRGLSAPSTALRALGVTSRESDVLAALATGATNNEIAARLHLSPRTVERHVSNLLAKTGAADRRELARLAASSRPT